MRDNGFYLPVEPFAYFEGVSPEDRGRVLFEYYRACQAVVSCQVGDWPYARTGLILGKESSAGCGGATSGDGDAEARVCRDDAQGGIVVSSVSDCQGQRVSAGSFGSGGLSDGSSSGPCHLVDGGSVSVEHEGIKPVGDLSGENRGGKRGKWYEHNKRRKMLKKSRRYEAVCSQTEVPAWRVGAKPVGQCETVVSSVSSCPSYGAALSDAERDAKDSLARRRVVENKVAMQLAKMKLASLQDERKCQEYADLKRQRMVQWQNESIAKSQASLDKCKSIDPGSSASQYEIREQAKQNRDMRAQLEDLFAALRKQFPNTSYKALG